MTDVNELRDMLHYPDDEYRLSADVIIQKARRRQRVRVTAAAGVSLLAAGLTAWSVWPLVAPNRAVSPPAAESSVAPAPTTSALPQPSPTSTVTRSSPTIGIIGKTPVDLGQGWSVWMEGTDVCLQYPLTEGQPSKDEPTVECRSTTDGNIGGLNIQTSPDQTGSFFRGIIPYNAARVALTFVDGIARDASVFRLEGRAGWTYYALYIQASEQPGSLVPTDGSPTVTAYDASGQVLGTLAAPPS